jgi:hypothetical protein
MHECRRNSNGVELGPRSPMALTYDDKLAGDSDSQPPFLGTSTNVVKGFALVNTITDCVLLSDWTWSAREFLTEDDEIIVFASVVKARRVMRRYPGAEVMPV